MSQNNNEFWDKLSARQIYIEIIKKISAMEYNSTMSMWDLFGDDWDLLDKKSRNAAIGWFRECIRSKEIKGIIYERNRDGSDMKDKNGDRLYTRIPNDRYQRK